MFNVFIFCSVMMILVIEIKEYIWQSKYENCLVIKGWLFSKACTKTTLLKVFFLSNIEFIYLKYFKTINYIIIYKAIAIMKFFLCSLFILLILYTVKLISMASWQLCENI